MTWDSRLQYLNRERRWNWGAVAELHPSVRVLPHQRLLNHDGQAAVSVESHYFEQMQLRVGGLLAYPLNHAQRIEFGLGVRHIRYRQTVQSAVRSLQTGRVLERTTTTGFGGAPASVGDVSAAFVGDTSVFGATSPILGSRYRFEMTSALGHLSFVRVLLDHRRYSMPAKPYTIATRIVHVGQYGRDADDPRLQPAFLGSRQFVHGYGWSSLQCQPAVENDCNAMQKLLGNRLVAGNLELRFPLMGVLSREIRYGPVPIDGFLFTDAGLVWSRSPLARRQRAKSRQQCWRGRAAERVRFSAGIRRRPRAARARSRMVVRIQPANRILENTLLNPPDLLPRLPFVLGLERDDAVLRKR